MLDSILGELMLIEAMIAKYLENPELKQEISNVLMEHVSELKELIIARQPDKKYEY